MRRSAGRPASFMVAPVCRSGFMVNFCNFVIASWPCGRAVFPRPSRPSPAPPSSPWSFSPSAASPTLLFESCLLRLQVLSRHIRTIDNARVLDVFLVYNNDSSRRPFRECVFCVGCAIVQILLMLLPRRTKCPRQERSLTL